MRSFRLARAVTAIPGDRVAIIALLSFRLLDDPIAATYVELTFGRAATITASVLAVVALLPENTVHHAVPAE